MSTSQLIPNTIAQVEQRTGNEAVCTEGIGTSWFTPNLPAYNNPYMTPFPSSTYETFPTSLAEPLQWPSGYDQPSNPEFFDGYSSQSVPVCQPPHMISPYQQVETGRNLFGFTNDILRSDNALGIQYRAPEPVNNTIASTPLPTFARQGLEQQQDRSFDSASPPGQQRRYPILAPNPTSLTAKRRREQEEEPSTSSSGKRRKSALSIEDLKDKDRLLLQLREVPSPKPQWTETAARFLDETGDDEKVATLQMRHTRLREKLREWESADIEALRTAHAYYEKEKWNIISKKMKELGRKWSPTACKTEWQELTAQELSMTSAEPTPTPAPVQTVSTPSMSQYPSPGYVPNYGHMVWQ